MKDRRDYGLSTAMLVGVALGGVGLVLLGYVLGMVVNMLADGLATVIRLAGALLPR